MGHFISTFVPLFVSSSRFFFFFFFFSVFFQVSNSHSTRMECSNSFEGNLGLFPLTDVSVLLVLTIDNATSALAQLRLLVGFSLLSTSIYLSLYLSVDPRRPRPPISLDLFQTQLYTEVQSSTGPGTVRSPRDPCLPELEAGCTACTTTSNPLLIIATSSFLTNNTSPFLVTLIITS